MFWIGAFGRFDKSQRRCMGSSEHKSCCRSRGILPPALGIRQKHLKPTDPLVAENLNYLARLLSGTSRRAEAEELHRRSLAIREIALGTNHLDVAASLNDLAWLLGESHAIEAESLFRRSLVINQQKLGLGHPFVATSLQNLGWLLAQTNRYADAEPLYREALIIREKCLGREDHRVASSLHSLGRLLAETYRPAEAEPLYRRALAIREKCFGLEDYRVASSLHRLARLLGETNRSGEAEMAFERSLIILLPFALMQGHARYTLTQAIDDYCVFLAKRGLNDEAITGRIQMLATQVGFTQSDEPIFSELMRWRLAKSDNPSERMMCVSDHKSTIS
jgi:tetratricopeptide (TPR) repeat protein